LRAIKHPFPIVVGSLFGYRFHAEGEPKVARIVPDPAPIRVKDNHGRSVIQDITELL
jgi:hypothetical protein